MRRYAALYDRDSNTWRIIFQDEGESVWYVEVPDVGNYDTAMLLVGALTNAAAS